MPVIKIISDYQEFRVLKDEWNRLLENNFSRGIWLQHEWYDCWWQAFGKSAELFVVVMYENNRLTAVIPLMIIPMRIKGIRQRVLRFIENAITPRSNFIFPGISVEKLKSLWDEIFKHSSRWDLAILANFEQGNSGYECWLKHLKGRKIKYVELPERISPYIQLSEGWEAVKAAFGKGLKGTINTKRNRLNREGEFALVTFSDASDLPRALSICEEISRRSWKGKLGTDMSGTAGRAKFYRLITAAAMSNGWVYIWFLKLNDRFIAFEYGLAADGHVLGLAVDYDLEFRKFSPGTVLRSLLLEQLIERGMTIYDFAGTVYDHKLEWTKKLRLHSQFWVFHRGMKSRMLYLIKARLLPAIARLKSKSPVREQPDLEGEDSVHAAS